MDKDQREKFLESLKTAFKEKMPSTSYICEQATFDVLGNKKDDKVWIKKHFSELVYKIEGKAYEIYLSYEQPLAGKVLRESIETCLGDNARAKTLDFIEENFWLMDKFLLSISQGRKSRAGYTLERIIRVLFTAIEYPHVQTALVNGTPDFVLPSFEHFKKNPMDAVIFTVKRTVRERWRQVTTEGTRGLQFFLGTIDEKVKATEFEKMLSNRVYVVVPKHIKAKRYKNAVNALSFEDFFVKYLDPAMRRWKADGVI